MDETQYTYTIAQARSVAERAMIAAGATREWARNIAREAFPDPVVLTHELNAMRAKAAGAYHAATGDIPSLYGLAAAIQAIASDFATRAQPPRVPVTVTEEIKARAWRIYRFFGALDHGIGFVAHVGQDVGAFGAALEAVADELAQPTQPCDHKATRWLVLDRNGCGTLVADTRESAEDRARRFDNHSLESAPHRVVALAEIEG